MKNRQAKILVIEDEESLLKIWEQKFQADGLNVLAAKNGEAALKIAFKDHPNLVVIDLVMPSSEGLMVVKKLREDKWGNRVPVVFLNSWREPEDFVDNSEASEFVPNNWSLKEVVQRVERKLETMKLAVN